MSKMEDTVKKYIVSVLTSTPLTMTISQLNKDYRNMLGEEIPYHKLGYNSLEHFLKSVPDTVQVNGNGYMATVLPVVSEKSKHINDLVTSQKIVKKKTPHRPTFPTQQRKYLQYQKPAFTYPINQPQRQKIFYPPSNSGSACQKVPESPVQNTPIKQTIEQTVTKLNLSTTQLPDKSPDYQRILDSHTPKSSSPVEEKSDVLNTSGCGRTKKLQSLLNKIPDELGNTERRVPLRVRENLKHMIGHYEEGIWCADVPKLYRQIFHSDINYEEFGFASLSQLCVSLPSIFHYSRPAYGDFKLYDKSKELPASADTEFTVASYSTTKRFSEENVCAIPNIDWGDVSNFLPKDVFKPGIEIPREFLPPETKEGDTIRIGIGEVYDLSKFWVYLNDDRLDDLMDQLQDFYLRNASKYSMPTSLIKDGIYCVQMFYNEYHRAFIVDSLPDSEDNIKVLFIDYGTMTKVSMNGVCFLHEQFAVLPAQAIRCRLADICPTEENVLWSRQAISTFRSMVKQRNLDAKVARINWKEQILEAYLIDATNPSNQFCLNTKLVESGVAQYPDQGLKKPKVASTFKPIVKYIHLFPTFLELEYGCAPSSQEMDILISCDVPISLCYPQYFSIDRTGEHQIISEVERFFSKHFENEPMRTCKIDNFDMSCVVTDEVDFDYFCDLAPDIEEFLKKKFAEHKRSEDITKLYQQLEEIKKETAEKIHQDRELAEDIMRDLEIVRYQGGASCSGTPEQDRDDGSELTGGLIGNGECGSESQDFGQYRSGGSDTSYSAELQDKPSFFTEERSISSTNTNPFLSDCCEQQEDAAEPLVLNPNNPFLPYLRGEVKEQNPSSPSSSSDNSSSSTLYESYIGEVKVEQKWANNEKKEVKIEQTWLSSKDNDVVSLVESLSIKHGADTEQASASQKNRDCAIQTATEEFIPQPIKHQVSQLAPIAKLPYNGYQPPQQFNGYSSWSTAADCAPFGYGSRYTTPGHVYSNFASPMQPWVMEMLCRMQMRSQYNSGMGPAYQVQPQYHPHPHQQVPYQYQPPGQQQFQPRGTIRPPPGFYPPPPAPSQASSTDTSDSSPTTPFQTPSSTSTSNSPDFYEAYNEHLKQIIGRKY